MEVGYQESLTLRCEAEPSGSEPGPPPVIVWYDEFSQLLGEGKQRVWVLQVSNAVGRGRSVGDTLSRHGAWPLTPLSDLHSPDPLLKLTHPRPVAQANPPTPLAQANPPQTPCSS